MPNLFLYTVHKNQYSDNSACAYIYYGTKKTPLDHKGKSIGVFSDDPFEHATYLKDHVLENLNAGLKGSNYVATGIDFINQAPHPFFNIQRRDKMSLTSHDLEKINLDLTKAINQVNKNAKKQHGMFASKSEAKQDYEHHEKKAMRHR